MPPAEEAEIDDEIWDGHGRDSFVVAIVVAAAIEIVVRSGNFAIRHPLPRRRQQQQQQRQTVIYAEGINRSIGV